ncbi:glycosyl transferase [Azospirillum doebereinerae]
MTSDTLGDAPNAPDPVLHALLPAVLPADAYSRRVVEALRAAGREVTVHALPGPHPQVDPSAILAADIALARLPDGAPVLLDGAALPNLAAALPIDDRRLRFVALVERLRWTDAGLEAEEAMARWHLEQGALALMRLVVVPDAAVAATVAALEVPAERVVQAAPEDAGTLLTRLSALPPLPRPLPPPPPHDEP